MSAAPWAVIDHRALRANLQLLRRQADGSRIWAVIKANAYGHGLAQAATSLRDLSDGLAVARVAEALQLRQAGCDLPLLVMGGHLDDDELRQAIDHRISLALHDMSQLDILQKSSRSLNATCWLKVDTGMHRLGFDPDQVPEVLRRLRGGNSLGKHKIALMSHLANADLLDHTSVRRQLHCLHSLADGSADALSLANSAAVLAFPDCHLDWVRPGISLYGVSPFPGECGAQRGLRPVMSLFSRIVAIKNLKPGDRIGYGGTYQCPGAARVAVVRIGYGDGYPRHAVSGTPVFVNGCRRPIVGRVSMDLISVDLQEDRQSRVGDKVCLWGDDLPVELIADKAATIPYELLTGLSTRVDVRHRFDEISVEPYGKV